jgi:small subunit ribosomal protein S17
MADENKTDEAQEAREVKPETPEDSVVEATTAGETLAHEVAPSVDSQAGDATGSEAGKRGSRSQKVGVVASDKMQKTVVVRVDRLILHPKYRRYVRRTSKFMAHDDLGATVGDKVRIIETRPLSARKRWRVVEIVQKAAK